MPGNSLHRFQNTGVAELRKKNPAIIACWRGLVPLTERSRIPVFLTGERLRNFQTGKAESWNFYPDSSFTHALRLFYRCRDFFYGEKDPCQEPKIVSVQVQHRYFDILSVSRHKEHPDSAFIFFVNLVANRINSLDFPGQKIKNEILNAPDQDTIIDPADCIFRKDLLYLSYYHEKIETNSKNSELKRKAIEARKKGRLIEQVWTHVFEGSIKQLASRGFDD